MTKNKKKVIKDLKKEGRKHILKGVKYAVLALVPIEIPLVVFIGSACAGIHFMEQAKQNRKNIDDVMCEIRESDEFKDLDIIDSDENIENYMKNYRPEIYERYQNEIKEELENKKKEHGAIGYGLIATTLTFGATIGVEDLLSKKGKTTAWDRKDNALDNFVEANKCYEKAKILKKEYMNKE